MGKEKETCSLGELTGVGMTKWAVVACDQFTSQPEYWEAVDKTVGDSPSTLRLILPEAELNDKHVDQHIANINAVMKDYLAGGVFKTLRDSLLYIERVQSDGQVRHGLIGMNSEPGRLLLRCPDLQCCKSNLSLCVQCVLRLYDYTLSISRRKSNSLPVFQLRLQGNDFRFNRPDDGNEFVVRLASWISKAPVLPSLAGQKGALHVASHVVGKP